MVRPGVADQLQRRAVALGGELDDLPRRRHRQPGRERRRGAARRRRRSPRGSSRCRTGRAPSARRAGRRRCARCRRRCPARRGRRGPSTMTPQPMPVPTFTTSTSWAEPATPDLAQRHHVHVVVDVDRAVVAAERAGDRVVVPARHDRRVRRPPGRELHRARARRRPRRSTSAGREPGLGEHLLRQPVDLGEHRPGPVGDVDRVADGREDLARTGR